jgi:L-amino acid N-acyltransferase YncA
MSSVIRAAVASDAPRMALIYNQGILERSSTFETALRSAADMLLRIEASERFPLLVACNAPGEVVGWAGVSAYRPRPCYAGIGEFSIYLDGAARGRGVGRQLLNALIDAAGRCGYWKLLSRVFPANAASRALCRACGFREVGTYYRHAKLDGRWLDVIIVERLIAANLG